MYPLFSIPLNSIFSNSIKQAENNIKIGVTSNQHSSIENLFKKHDIQILKGSESELNTKLKKGDIALILDIPDTFDNDLLNNKRDKLNIIYDNSSNTSVQSSNIVINILNANLKELTDKKLEKLGIQPDSLYSFTISIATLNSKDKPNNQALFFLGMLPSFIILFMLSPTMSIASDLGAGEKERGTIEPLLSTSVNRTTILFSKITTIVIVSLISLVMSLIGMLVSMHYSVNLVKSLNLSNKTIFIIILFSLLVSIVISSIEMAISLFARSMKESNSYLTGLFMPVLFLSYVPMMMDAKTLKQIFFNMPIVNTVCIIKQAMFGIYNYKNIILVSFWHLIYIFIAIVISIRIFSKEEVIFRS